MSEMATKPVFHHRWGTGATAGLTLPVGLALSFVLAGCASQTPSPQPSTHPTPEAQTPAGPTAASAKALSINTPVSTIAANPAGKAVLEHDLPGLLERPEYGVFKNMTVKSLAGLSNGKISPQTLDQVQHDLQAIPPGAPPQP